jgi:hypothetical protein
MNKLQQLYAEFAQSPWLDNVKRSYLAGGELDRLVKAKATEIRTRESEARERHELQENGRRGR